jgi:hypothetical protein
MEPQSDAGATPIFVQFCSFGNGLLDNVRRRAASFIPSLSTGASGYELLEQLTVAQDAYWVGWAASEVPFVLVLFRRPPAKPDVILS